MRTVRGLVAALLVGLAITAFAPTPAYACSCAAVGTAEFIDNADVVMAGTFTERDEPVLGKLISSADPVTYTVEVDRVYQGAVGRTIEILTPASGASCGLEGVELGRRYVVFASRETIMAEPTEDLWANLCGGTAPADAELVAEVEATLGEGSAPGSGPDGTPAGEPLAAPFALASGGALVVLAGLLWLRFWRQ